MWLGDPFVHFPVSCSLSQVFHHSSPRILSPHSQGTSFPRHQIMPPLTILHSRGYHVSSTENAYATSLPATLPLPPKLWSSWFPTLQDGHLPQTQEFCPLEMFRVEIFSVGSFLPAMQIQQKCHFPGHLM